MHDHDLCISPTIALPFTVRATANVPPSLARGSPVNAATILPALLHGIYHQWERFLSTWQEASSQLFYNDPLVWYKTKVYWARGNELSIRPTVLS